MAEEWLLRGGAIIVIQFKASSKERVRSTRGAAVPVGSNGHKIGSSNRGVPFVTRVMSGTGLSVIRSYVW